MDYVNSGHVTAYGPGLIHGMVNKPAVFTVNTKDAGEGTVVLFFHTRGTFLGIAGTWLVLKYFVLYQVAYLWPSRDPQRQISAALTTRMVLALCLISLFCLETTTSLSSIMTSTSLVVPMWQRLQVSNSAKQTGMENLSSLPI